MMLTKQIKAEISDFAERHGMRPQLACFRASGNSSFWKRLGEGRVTIRTVEDVLAWMRTTDRREKRLRSS